MIIQVKVGPDVTLDPDLRLKDTPTLDPFADPDEVKVPGSYSLNTYLKLVIIIVSFPFC
jgi:hypothetical protein